MKILITFLVGMLFGALTLWGLQIFTTNTKTVQTEMTPKNTSPLQATNTLAEELVDQTQAIPEKSERLVDSSNPMILISNEPTNHHEGKTIQPPQEYSEPDDFLFITSRVHQFNAENSGTYLNNLDCTEAICKLDLKFAHGKESITKLAIFMRQITEVDEGRYKKKVDIKNIKKESDGLNVIYEFKLQ